MHLFDLFFLGFLLWTTVCHDADDGLLYNSSNAQYLQSVNWHSKQKPPVQQLTTEVIA